MKSVDIYFDGTGISLNSSTEISYGKSVVGHAFVSNTSEELFFNRLDYATILSSSNTNPYRNEHCKIYFAGPSAKNSTFQGLEYKKPGKDYNPSKISTAGLSKYSTTNRLGISGDGWEHNLQLAVVSTINLITESLTQKPNQKITVNIPAAYSRGGITAIAFSHLLSNTLKNMGITSDQVSIGQIHAIDPVAGSNYGTLEKSIKRHSYKNHLASVSPLRIGSYTDSLTLHIATQERRRDFKPQLPYGLDTTFKNNRPLFIPDSVKTNIRLSHACHQTIAYPEYLGEASRFPAGCKTFRLVTGKDFDTRKKEDITWRHLGNSGNNLIFPKEDRCVKETTNHTAPEIIQQYSNSVLYDVYRYFVENNHSNNTFQQALTNPDNKFNDLIVWAYKNSNFYRITKLELDSFNGDKLSQVLLQAVHCKSREDLALMSLQYKHYGRCFSVNNTSKLTHEDLERIISSPDERQKDYLQQLQPNNKPTLLKEQILIQVEKNIRSFIKRNSQALSKNSSQENSHIYKVKEKLENLQNAEKKIRKSINKEQLISAVNVYNAVAEVNTARWVGWGKSSTPLLLFSNDKQQIRPYKSIMQQL
jgi:hypothetical protein